ncbi:unnamed protein product [Heligmosomoides polygyrus]|uniref:Uncharacterized protein n=1 Tax=Heligmosomoides polygyrus TaxID=6339 RepID=A0A3P8EIL2_HELPZ|nr:unnamed protein product [Heligmosomoides polygyrus]
MDAITEKLSQLEAPTLNSAAKADANGRGKAGRVDQTESSGYVNAYKNKDTYDKSHGKQ